MPVYTVTLATMDTRLGSNPFYHSCILLSQTNEKNQLEIVDNYGFYGQPATQQNPIFLKIKASLGVSTDFYNNNGRLKHEEARSIDAGYGLKGVTFELTKEKFQELQDKCKQMLAGQEAVREEFNRFLHRTHKPDGNSKETENQDTEISLLRYQVELLAAKIQQRPSRLAPFQLIGTMHTCKSQALNLLSGIITDKQMQRVTGTHRAISRLSGRMENFYAFSAGPTEVHHSKSRGLCRYRDLNNPAVKLYWALPPQEIETLSTETNQLFKITCDDLGEIKKRISQLIQIEWLFTNATFPAIYAPHQKELLIKIRAQIIAFSRIDRQKTPPTKLSKWQNSLFWVLSKGKNQKEQQLIENLKDTKVLINAIYSAIIDNWSIGISQGESKGESIDDAEAIATLLPEKLKKQFCNIIGRSYLKTAEVQEQSALQCSPRI